MTAKYKKGWYWVRYTKHDPDGKTNWIPGLWLGSMWCTPRATHCMDPGNRLQIGERIPTQNELRRAKRAPKE